VPAKVLCEGGVSTQAHNLALKWEGEVILLFDLQEKTVFCQQEEIQMKYRC